MAPEYREYRFYAMHGFSEVGECAGPLNPFALGKAIGWDRANLPCPYTTQRSIRAFERGRWEGWMLSISDGPRGPDAARRIRLGEEYYRY